ncbi:hypothetical protein T03_10736 [Trichinella britovi]|uniref:Uncharacterized protein n=1 Tax=Trichinella britovi TaxID=45882 RepID=A0A0V1C6Q5_TRIBR|nr:hypothetical protein T03_10736 [Trichinella britovi]
MKIDRMRRKKTLGHSVYYATLFALYTFKLHERLLTRLIIFSSGTFKKHQIASSVQRYRKYVTLASAE